ncbi:MAG: DegT/DnrJ/EryC1/StrS family aminotransferase [Opitutales bacterium]
MTETLALLGGTPVGAPDIPPFPQFDEAAIAAVGDILRSGKTVALGRTHPAMVEAEEAVSAYHGGRPAMVLSSGHASLMAALFGLEIGPGDEVITSPYTWGSTVASILHVGAIPVFADVDDATGLLDPASVATAVTPATKAIIAVHIYGQPADMAALRAIADKHGLFLVEDGSQAHGARIDGLPVGNFGDAAGFSCMGGKLLATAEAGYLITANEEAFWKAALMTQHYGRSAEPAFPDALKPYVDSLNYTFRLTPMVAALFPSQLAKLDDEVAARRRNVAALREGLSGIDCLALPEYADGLDPAWHMVTLNFRPEVAGVARDTFLKALQAEGAPGFAYVPSGIHRWSRLHARGYTGPAAPWIRQLAEAGPDYARQSLPQCDHKVATSIEIMTNGWATDLPQAVEKTVAGYRKVVGQLDALRTWEKDNPPAETSLPQVAMAQAHRSAELYKPKAAKG